jgi:hypothetical protein
LPPYCLMGREKEHNTAVWRMPWQRLVHGVRIKPELGATPREPASDVTAHEPRIHTWQLEQGCGSSHGSDIICQWRSYNGRPRRQPPEEIQAKRGQAFHHSVDLPLAPHIRALPPLTAAWCPTLHRHTSPTGPRQWGRTRASGRDVGQATSHGYIIPTGRAGTWPVLWLFSSTRERAPAAHRVAACSTTE